MKRIQIIGKKISELIEDGILPNNLHWIGEIPPTYSISFFSDNEETKTIIVAVDSFGGGVSWAGTNEKIDLNGFEKKEMEEILDKDETIFLKEKYPALLETINHLK